MRRLASASVFLGAMAFAACRTSTTTRQSEPSRAAPSPRLSASSAAAAPRPATATHAELLLDDTQNTVLLGATEDAVFLARMDEVEWQPDGSSKWKKDHQKRLVVIDADGLKLNVEHDVPGVHAAAACSPRLVWAEDRGKIWLLRQLPNPHAPIETLAELPAGEGVSNLVCAGDRVVACSCDRPAKSCTFTAYGMTSASARVVASNQSSPGIARVRAAEGFVYWKDEQKKAILRAPLSGGAVQSFVSLQGSDVNMRALSADEHGLTWLNSPVSELEPTTLRFLPTGAHDALTVETGIDFVDSEGRWAKDRRVHQRDPLTGRPVLLATEIDGPFVIAGRAIVSFRHVLGVAGAPGHFVLERKPLAPLP